MYEGGNMNILVLGNGFDLAQDLQTKYLQYLQTISIFKEAKLR